MKLYSVRESWKPKYAKKYWYRVTLIIAESEKDALCKYKEECTRFEDDSLISASEQADGFYQCTPRQSI